MKRDDRFDDYNQVKVTRLQKFKEEVVQEKYNCAFDPQFVQHCLNDAGFQLSYNYPDQHLSFENEKIIGLTVLKNVYRVLEKVELQQQSNDKQNNQENQPISLDQVVRAMGFCGLNFLQPETVDEILKQ